MEAFNDDDDDDDDDDGGGATPASQQPAQRSRLMIHPAFKPFDILQEFREHLIRDHSETKKASLRWTPAVGLFIQSGVWVLGW